MKNLTLLAVGLLLASCGMPPRIVETLDNPLGRQFERVIDRHDDYAAIDGDFGALAESKDLQDVLELGAVDAGVLLDVAEPVLDRHDQYVISDPSLDTEMEVPIFLLTTRRLRSILTTASK